MPTGSTAVSCLCAVISRYPCELRDSGAYKAGSMGYISVPRQWNPLVRSSTWWHHGMGMFSAWLPLCEAPVVYPNKLRDSITDLTCFHSVNVLMMWQSNCRWCDTSFAVTVIKSLRFEPMCVSNYPGADSTLHQISYCKNLEGTWLVFRFCHC